MSIQDSGSVAPLGTKETLLLRHLNWVWKLENNFPSVFEELLYMEHSNKHESQSLYYQEILQVAFF